MDEKIRLITTPLTRLELKVIAQERYGDMVKAVVDLEKKIMAIGAEMHVDEETFLIDNGSEQVNLWGINLYHERAEPDFVEFDSMINLRPKQNNRTRSIDSVERQNEIKTVVKMLVKDI